MVSVAVVVQGCPAPGRPGDYRVKASIEGSDIGTDYVWRVHPPGISIPEHLYACLRAGRDMGADYVLRFEDDVVVNRFILHNIRTWPALTDPRFGMGWLFDPGAITGSKSKTHGHARKAGTDFWANKILPFSQAVLMRTADVDTIVEHTAYYYKTRASYDGEQDWALSYAGLQTGRQIAIHAPSLVEHLIRDMPSQLGHAFEKRWGSSNGSFDIDFMRDGPRFDRFGRLVESRH